MLRFYAHLAPVQLYVVPFEFTEYDRKQNTIRNYYRTFVIVHPSIAITSLCRVPLYYFAASILNLLSSQRSISSNDSNFILSIMFLL